jgi:hypothetical protein
MQFFVPNNVLQQQVSDIRVPSPTDSKTKARVTWKIWERRIGDRISQSSQSRDWEIASMKRRYRDDLRTLADEDDNMIGL